MFLFFCFLAGGSGGEGYSLVWPIRGCAAGHGMAFYLSGLNRVYDFVQVCPNWGQGDKFEGVVLNRVRVSNPQRLAYTQHEILVVHRSV